MTPWFQDDSTTLYHGDALAVATELPSGSVDCIVTSPPYYGLRDYGEPGQYGLEPSPVEYVETMRALFAELRRVLADDGTLWLNLGDSYAANSEGAKRGRGGWKVHQRADPVVQPRSGLPPKNMIGIPWRVAFALQGDGWILRNAIVWHKPNAMPESITDRLSSRYEQVFLFSKARRYWFDLDPIREPAVTQRASALLWARDSKEGDMPDRARRQHRAERPDPAVRGKASGVGVMPTGAQHTAQHERGRNPGDVWSIPTAPFPGAHFAVMPPALAERCVLAGCRPGGTVLDPFSGSGTTGLAAAKHGRRYVGVDLSAEYLGLSLRTRLQQPALNIEEV
ncbi:DNA-methyltransferase [Nocardia farcinica]|uniref:DNA-methyltransferase n=1 Tax=Nocardia farcinica TaxID=37329 RepID=UPI002454845C|nr:site-specific DNA-methyltransferase [Nocardia farcinica]